jgi:hypothetical protein
MRTNDVILFGLGLIAGYFFKSNLDKRNALSSENSGVNSLPADTNYVFSQKYKDCEAKVSEMLASTAFKVTANFDMNAYKKNAIDRCMKGGAF